MAVKGRRVTNVIIDRFQLQGGRTIAREMANIGRNVSMATVALRSFKSTLVVVGRVLLAFTGFNTLARGVRSLVRELVFGVGQLEMFKVELGVMYRSLEKGGKMLAWLQRLAIRTPFEIPHLVKAATQLRAWNLSVRDTIMRASDLTIAMGLSSEGISDVANMIGRVINRGANWGRTLVALRGDLRIFNQVLAQTGDRLKAFMAATAHVAGLTEKVFGTLPQLLSNIKDAVGILIRFFSVYSGFYDHIRRAVEGVMNTLLDLVDGISTVDVTSREAMQRIRSQVDSFLSGLVDMMKRGLLDMVRDVGFLVGTAFIEGLINGIKAIWDRQREGIISWLMMPFMSWSSRMQFLAGKAMGALKREMSGFAPKINPAEIERELESVKNLSPKTKLLLNVSVDTQRIERQLSQVKNDLRQKIVISGADRAESDLRSLAQAASELRGVLATAGKSLSLPGTRDAQERLAKITEQIDALKAKVEELKRSGAYDAEAAKNVTEQLNKLYGALADVNDQIKASAAKLSSVRIDTRAFDEALSALNKLSGPKALQIRVDVQNLRTLTDVERRVQKLRAWADAGLEIKMKPTMDPIRFAAGMVEQLRAVSAKAREIKIPTGLDENAQREFGQVRQQVEQLAGQSDRTAASIDKLVKSLIVMKSEGKEGTVEWNDALRRLQAMLDVSAKILAGFSERADAMHRRTAGAIRKTRDELASLGEKSGVSFSRTLRAFDNLQSDLERMGRELKSLVKMNFWEYMAKGAHSAIEETTKLNDTYAIDFEQLRANLMLLQRMANTPILPQVSVSPRAREEIARLADENRRLVAQYERFERMGSAIVSKMEAMHRANKDNTEDYYKLQAQLSNINLLLRGIAVQFNKNVRAQVKWAAGTVDSSAKIREAARELANDFRGSAENIETAVRSIGEVMARPVFAAAAKTAAEQLRKVADQIDKIRDHIRVLEDAQKAGTDEYNQWLIKLQGAEEEGKRIVTIVKGLLKVTDQLGQKRILVDTAQVAQDLAKIQQEFSKERLVAKIAVDIKPEHVRGIPDVVTEEYVRRQEDRLRQLVDVAEQLRETINALGEEYAKLDVNTPDYEAQAVAMLTQMEGLTDQLNSVLSLIARISQELSLLGKGVKTSGLEEAFRRYKDVVRGFATTMAQSFGDAFADGIMGVQKFSDAFSNAFKQIEHDMYAFMAKWAIFSAILAATGMPIGEALRGGLGLASGNPWNVVMSQAARTNQAPAQSLPTQTAAPQVTQNQVFGQGAFSGAYFVGVNGFDDLVNRSIHRQAMRGGEW